MTHPGLKEMGLGSQEMTTQSKVFQKSKSFTSVEGRIAGLKGASKHRQQGFSWVLGRHKEVLCCSVLRALSQILMLWTNTERLNDFGEMKGVYIFQPKKF